MNYTSISHVWYSFERRSVHLKRNVQICLANCARFSLKETEWKARTYGEIKASLGFVWRKERTERWLNKIMTTSQPKLLSKCAWRQSDGQCLRAIGFELTFSFIDAVLSELFFPAIQEKSGCGLNTASEKGFFSTSVQVVLYYFDRYKVQPVLFVNCIYWFVWF